MPQTKAKKLAQELICSLCVNFIKHTWIIVLSSGRHKVEHLSGSWDTMLQNEQKLKDIAQKYKIIWVTILLKLK